jgi:hypothetical protein
MGSGIKLYQVKTKKTARGTRKKQSHLRNNNLQLSCARYVLAGINGDKYWRDGLKHFYGDW